MHKTVDERKLEALYRQVQLEIESTETYVSRMLAGDAPLVALDRPDVELTPSETAALLKAGENPVLRQAIAKLAADACHQPIF